MLQMILLQCTNLEELYYTDIRYNFDDIEGELPRLKLNVLDVTNQSKIYDLLKNSFVKSFRLTINSNNPSNTSIQQFLTQQKNLQSLAVKFYPKAQSFFGDDFNKKATLQLKNLEIKSSLKHFKEHYAGFLNQTKNSLHKIVVKQVDEFKYLNIFTNLPNLKVLEISVHDFTENTSFNGLPQVEHLTFDASGYFSTHLMGKFPNLKTLDIKSHRTKSIFECYAMLMEIIVGSCDLIIEKASVGMDDFKSHNSSFVISQEVIFLKPCSSEPPNNLTVMAHLKKNRYGMEEIRTEGIFTVKNKVFKVRTTNGRYQGILTPRKRSENCFDEMFVKIFSFLPSSDILTLTETSVRFEKIISNSILLMRRFPLTTSHALETYKWRKFSSIILTDYHEMSSINRTVSVIDAIQSNLIQLEIGVCDISDLPVLNFILQMCPTVKFVKIFLQNYIYNSKNLIWIGATPDYPKLNLNYLEAVDGLFALDVFSVCSVKKLNIKLTCQSNFFDIQDLKKFLLAQSELQSLRLENFNDTFGFFTDQLIEEIKFRLTKLEIICSKELLTPQFYKFLEVHRNSLKTFKVDEIEKLEIFNSLSPIKNSKELDAGGFRSRKRKFSPMPHVEDLNLRIFD